MRVCLAQRRLYYSSTQTVSGELMGLTHAKPQTRWVAQHCPALLGGFRFSRSCRYRGISSSGDTKLIRGQNNSCRMRRPLVHFYLAYCRLSEPRGNMLYLPGRNHSTVLPLHQKPPKMQKNTA